MRVFSRFAIVLTYISLSSLAVNTLEWPFLSVRAVWSPRSTPLVVWFVVLEGRLLRPGPSVLSVLDGAVRSDTAPCTV